MEKIKVFLWKYKWILFVIQGLICCGTFCTIYFSQRGVQEIDMRSAELAGGYIQEDGSTHIDETDGAYGLYLNVYTDKIEKGWYKFHVKYETGYDDNGFLVRSLNGNPNAINEDIGDEIETIILKSQNTEKSVHVWVEEATGLQISVHFCGGGYLDVEGMTLEKVPNYTLVFFVALLFLLTDLLLAEVMYVSPVERKRRYFVRGGIIAIALVSSIPLMNRYVLMGNDIMFHLCRIEGIAEGIYSGQFPVRVMPQWWDEYGYGVSMFYGDALLYFPAVMLLLNYKLQTAYKSYMALINLMTVWIAYKSFKKIGGDEKVALFGAAVYSLNMFRLMNIYFNNGVGVYTGMMFLPLVVSGFYYVKEKRGWLYLALGLTGCIQSHMMTCEMVGIFIILVMIIGIRWIFRKTVLFNLCKAGIAVLLWNLWFIVPFLNLYPGEYKIKSMDKLTSNIQKNGRDFTDWFRAVVASLNGETDVQWLGLFIGFTLSGGLLFVLITIIIKRKNKEIKNIAIGAGAASGLAFLALFLCTKYFPYDFLCEKSELLAVLIHSLQFQWRFLELAAVLAATAVVFGFVIWKKLGYKKVCITMAGVLGGICLLETAFYYRGVLIESPYMTQISEYYAMPEAMGGAEEYLPIAAERLYERHELIMSDMVEVEEYEKEYTTILTSCINHNMQEAYIDVPLFFYPCYKARDVETGEVLALTYGENAKIRIILPAGYQGTIKLEVNERKLWKIADMISFISVMASVIILFGEEKIRRLTGMRSKKK